MRFNSIEFLLFFFIVVAFYYWLPHRWRWLWLCISSCLFYLSFLPLFLLALILVILLDYFIGRGLAGTKPPTKKWLFGFGVAANVLVLAFFKYGALSGTAVASAANFLGLHYPRELIQIVLPLGFSFFIFSSLSYLIEIRRGRIQPERHLGYLAAYFLFFPKLAQGPIERPYAFLPQLHTIHGFNAGEVSAGLKMMLWGYFKKLVIADRLALYVNVVLENEPLHNGSSLLLAILFYSFQIYADFSGYTDIALGTARILGFQLSPNFRQPYLALSVKEFWARWHITLSTWLRDYIFLPLSYKISRLFNRERYLGMPTDRLVYALAVMTTFLVCGAWHGEGLNYLIWGAVFGAFLVISNWTAMLRKRAQKKLRTWLKALPVRALRRGFVFCLVTFAWIFFRGGDLSRIVSIIQKILFDHGRLFIGSRAYLIYSIFGILCLILIDHRAETGGGQESLTSFKHPVLRLTSDALLIIIILTVGVLDGGQFIYSRF